MTLAGVIAAVAFIALAAAGCAAAVLAVLGTAHVYLSGPEAIEHDGLARGRKAPRWSLADSAGAGHQSPPARPLQLVLFADHSLKSFPSVVDGLRSLLMPPAGGAGGIGGSPPLDNTADPDLDVVILLRQRNDLAEPLLRLLGLDGVPVLTGTPALYAAYNVRVGPFAIFVDSAGQVRASSLVNYDWQLTKLRQLAGLPIGPGQTARRPARAGLRRLSRRAA